MVSLKIYFLILSTLLLFQIIKTLTIKSIFEVPFLNAFWQFPISTIKLNAKNYVCITLRKWYEEKNIRKFSILVKNFTLKPQLHFIPFFNIVNYWEPNPSDFPPLSSNFRSSIIYVQIPALCALKVEICEDIYASEYSLICNYISNIQYAHSGSTS